MTETTSDWEPGAPSGRAMLRSTLGGAIVPIVAYYVIRQHVASDSAALILAGCFPAGWVAAQWIRSRRIDPIGMVTLLGFVAGVASAELTGGSAFALKARDSAFTLIDGIGCLISLRFGRRPLMFSMGKALSAGDDPAKRSAYDELWSYPDARRSFNVITAVWGLGLIAEASARVALALVLSTNVFVAVSPVLAAICFSGLFAWTAFYGRRSQARGEAAAADAEQDDFAVSQFAA